MPRTTTVSNDDPQRRNVQEMQEKLLGIAENFKRNDVIRGTQVELQRLMFVVICIFS